MKLWHAASLPHGPTDPPHCSQASCKGLHPLHQGLVRALLEGEREAPTVGTVVLSQPGAGTAAIMALSSGMRPNNTLPTPPPRPLPGEEGKHKTQTPPPT